jgi:UDP-3-O-[3-hydroxymyristoyl] glucosamine N-acyltransferase
MSKSSELDGVAADPLISVGKSIILFLGACYLSILPATTTGYVFLKFFNPWTVYASTGSWLAPFVVYLAAVGLSLLVLYGWSWLQAKLAVGVLMGFKEIPEGRFKKSLHDKGFQQFTNRHIVKKFSMWLFKFHAQRWLYRKYTGSFMKMGKHVEVSEYFPLERCEVGDNTVIARPVVIGSHVIEGEAVTVKQIKIGKNCIIDADDEMRGTCIGPGSILEDNVIVKAGTGILKDFTLKAGGIYEGDLVLRRVGEVSDLSKQDIENWRKSVLSKNKLPSRMLREWSSFTSRRPRVVDKIATLVGYTAGIGTILVLWLLSVNAIDGIGPIIGSMLNIFLLPPIFFLAYVFNFFIPLVVEYPTAKRYQASIPGLKGHATGEHGDIDSTKKNIIAEITDPEMIEKWKCCKWLKWRMVERVLHSMFPEASTALYQYIGVNNNVALKSSFTEARVDTDYVTIGEHSLVSLGTHVYAYSLVEGPNPRLVIKHTAIGRNCVLAPSVILAGASIGDNVMLGIHSLVPEDAHLEGNQLYAGNPVTDWKSFMARKKQARENLGNKD